MKRSFKVACLAIALTALAVLAIFGFAIWVFIPLLPAAIVYLIAVTAGKRRVLGPDHEAEAKSESREAA